MNKTNTPSLLQRVSRSAGFFAVALAINAGAAWGFTSLDTKGERRLASEAAVQGSHSFVVYLGELPEIRVCGARA